MAAWQTLIELGSRSRQVFTWSLKGKPTAAAFSRIQGKPFLVQFWAEGPLAGQVADAFVPNQKQLAAIYSILKSSR
jgi:hypothetical protein